MRVALVVFLMVGCGEVVPELPPWDGIEVDPPARAGVAIDTVISFYAVSLGEPRPPTVVVHWVSEQIPYVGGAEPFVSGLCGSCDALVVFIPASDYPIHRTALAHEIAHCMGGDYHHQDEAWWGTYGLKNLAFDQLVKVGL